MKKSGLLCLLIGLAISLPIIVNGQKTVKIDCNVSAYLPGDTWSVPDPQKAGIFEFNPATVKIVDLSGPQSKVKMELIAERIKNSACPVNVLDYLLAHQELIPVEWQGKTIIFTGTLYHDPTGYKCYRTMVFWNGSWDWNRSYPEDYCANCASIIAN